MFVQLLTVSVFISSLSTPLLIFYLILNFGNLSTDINPSVELSLLYLLLFSILFLPFIMLLSLSKEYWFDKWKRFLCCRRRRRQVEPALVISNTRGRWEWVKQTTARFGFIGTCNKVIKCWSCSYSIGLVNFGAWKHLKRFPVEVVPNSMDFFRASSQTIFVSHFEIRPLREWQVDSSWTS